MAQTVLEYKNQMRHAIGGEPDSRVSLIQVLNEACRYLLDQHPWSFRERPTLAVTVAAVAPPTDPVTYNAYVALPADFGEVISVACGARDVQLTSLEEIAHRRNGLVLAAPLASIYVALSFPAQASITVTQALPRLEIFPTPNNAMVLTIDYRAGAIALSSDTDVPNIPLSFERSLTLIARAFIQDYEEQDATSEWAKVKEELDLLKGHDGLAQQNMGEMRGGAVNEARKRVNFWVSGVSAR